MNIGEFKSVDGRLMGQIFTRTLDLPRLGLRPVDSNNARAPLFEVVSQNVGGRWIQLGALWEAKSNTTGEMFLQGSIDDPSFPESLPIALFGTDAEGYRVAWRRPQPRADFGASVRGPRRDYGSERNAAGGFGDSTAGADGAFAGSGTSTELDDDVHF